MGSERLSLVCATLAVVYLSTIAAQNGLKKINAPPTRFTCSGRAAGYYADIDTGCQVYHMCDGLGRQFSYTCPNTTLFQQRMLICDHWYMVNCSMSERDYSANLLIGQRDKPFVSDEEMRFRTPRPDILSVPANSNYFNGLKEAESKYHPHPGNSIVGVADSISSANNNGLDSDKVNYRPPTSWSTKKPPTNQEINTGEEQDSLTGAASQRPRPSVQTTPRDQFTQNTKLPIATPTPPSKYFQPPPAPTTESASSEEMDIDIRMKSPEDEVVNFIRRFDPNSPDSIQTSMTKTEILNLNSHLPAGQSSAEDDRNPRRNKNVGNDFNRVENDNNKKGFIEHSRFDTVNTKPAPSQATVASDSRFSNVPTPVTDLIPPKDDSETSSVGTTTTVGPPIYYEWKWAAPAFDLEPPKESNATNATQQEKRNIPGHGKNPFVTVTRPPPPDLEPVAPTKNTEYNISSYFVPDYVFPLDKGHPGYEGEDAHTSFNVEIARPGRRSFGENPACPQCHPAYLNPGSCEPCIVKR